jgi:hypothetical protein
MLSPPLMIFIRRDYAARRLITLIFAALIAQIFARASVLATPLAIMSFALIRHYFLSLCRFHAARHYAIDATIICSHFISRPLFTPLMRFAIADIYAMLLRRCRDAVHEIRRRRCFH